MKVYDAHTHLNSEPLLVDWKSYLQKFIDAGGAGLINSWASESYNIQGIEIAKIAERDFKNCIVKTTLGWHPLECVDGTIVAHDISAKMQRLKDLYSTNKKYVVAIGETGIDVHYPNGLETLETQKKLFVQHCDLAREFDLPLVVHSRDAFDQTLDVLEKYQDLVVYFHCRGYGPEELKKLQEAGFKKLYIGFCGNVTYKKTDALRESLKLVPLDSLLLETDAPYLTPQIVRWETNHPANVQYIYEFVAEALHIAPEALSKQLEANFHSVYKI